MALESPSNSLGSSLQLGPPFRSFMQELPTAFPQGCQTCHHDLDSVAIRNQEDDSTIPSALHLPFSCQPCEGNSATWDQRLLPQSTVSVSVGCCRFPGPGRLPSLLFPQIQSLAGWDLVLVALIQLFLCRAQVSLRALIFLTITASFLTCPGCNSN